MNEYKKAYEREKRNRKINQQESAKIINELKQEISYLKSTIQTSSFNDNEFDEKYKLSEYNINPIFCINDKGLVVYSNRIGFEILNGFGLKLNEEFPFFNQNLDSIDEKIYYKKRIFKTHTVNINSNFYYVFCTDISDYDDASYLLKKSEQSYQFLFNSVNDVIFKLNSNGEFILVNQKAVDLSGYSNEELLSKKFTDLIVPNSRKKVFKHYQNLIKSKITHDYYEYEIESKSGEIINLGQNISITYITDDTWTVNAIARDITKLKNIEKALSLSEEKYRSTLENLDFGLLEVDLNEEITKVYDGFVQLTGYSHEELLGKKPFELLLDNNSKGLMLKQIEKRNSGESSVYEIEIVCKDNSKKWVLISGTPIYDGKNNMIGSLGIHVDITERKIMEEELIVAEKKASDNAKSKELFLAKMSHELRTPLNAILGFSQVLSEVPELKSFNSEINSIYTSADHLLEIVNDLLDLTKLNHGKLKFESIPFSIKQIIKDLILVFKVQSEKKGITLKIDIDVRDDIRFLGDPTRLRQIISNLLSNAIKFTNEGYVLLKCRTYLKENNDYVFMLEIKDTGIGIGQDSINRLMDDFEQVDSSISREYGGTGLGLSIVQNIIDKLNGEINIVSEIGFGTCINVKIPYEISRNNYSEVKKLVDDEEINIPENTKVLLVDDNKFNLNVAESFLNSKNIPSVSCVSGEEAIEIYDDSFTHVLMDIQMPNLNGYEVSNLILNKDKNANIIAVTAGLIEDKYDHFFKCVLSKPFKKNELFKAIRNNSKEIEFTLDKLIKLFEGDMEVVNSLLKTFIDIMPGNIDKLKKYNRDKDKEGVLSICHKINPSLKYLNFLKELEFSCKIQKNLKEQNESHVETYEVVDKLISMLSKCLLKVQNYHK